MIGSITTVGEGALLLGPVLERMVWTEDAESYLRLREEANKHLEKMELEGVSLPSELAQFAGSYQEIRRSILDHLSTVRGKVNGDVIGLPLFLLTGLSYRAATLIATGTPQPERMEQIQGCLEDLGVDCDLVQVLEREAGWIMIQAEGGEETIGEAEAIHAASSFVIRALEEFGRSEPELKAIAQGVTAVGREVASFRAESRASSARLEQLAVEGNTQVMAALGEVKAALIREDTPPAEAEALTEGDPEAFGKRLARWISGAEAKGAAEAALWAALDFVPGGVGVKLGFKVAGAIRGALKADTSQ